MLLIGIVVISSFSIVYIAFILINDDIPKDDNIVLEYNYNVFPSGNSYAKERVSWEFNFSIGGSGIYYGDHWITLQTVNTVVIIMDQHQWAIYEKLVYYRDNGDIIRRDVVWANYVEHYILSIGKTFDNGTWDVPYDEIWCLDFFILDVIENIKIFTNASWSYRGSWYSYGGY